MRSGSVDPLGIREYGFPCAAHVVDALAMIQDGRHDLVLGTDDFPAAGAPNAQVLACIRMLHELLLLRAPHASARNGSGT